MEVCAAILLKLKDIFFSNLQTTFNVDYHQKGRITLIGGDRSLRRRGVAALQRVSGARHQRDARADAPRGAPDLTALHRGPRFNR